eukprot:NODE_289_length_10645_cov_0.615115.p5 type:complete len:263 gc:universal NODE_289_length_10645_cov_0.615115:1928-1140(-)
MMLCLLCFKMSSVKLFHSRKYEMSPWGAPDSLVNWCEPDYMHFSFMAETFNTLSNLLTVIVGAVLFFHFRKHHTEKRFLSVALLMIVVGLGSAAFHGTLRYHFQLLDELPMLYLTCSLSYIVIEMPHQKKKYPNLPRFSIMACFLMSVGHIAFKNAELFFAAFGILLAPAISYPVTHTTVKLFYDSMKYAFFSLVIGFIAWEFDRFFCEYVQNLYLHAWWHVFTAMSGLFWLNGMLFLRKRYILKEPCRLLYHGLWVDLESK